MGLIRLYQDQNGQQQTGAGTRIRLYSDPLPTVEDQPIQTDRDRAIEAASRDVMRTKGFRAASEFVQKQQALANSSTPPTISAKPEKEWPLGFVGRAAKKTWETAKGIFNDSVERITDSIDTVLDRDGVPLKYIQDHWYLTPDEQKKQYLAEGNKPVTPATRIGRMINVGTSAANIAFIPVTSAFAGAEEIPVVKYPVKAVGWGFEKLGQAGAFVGSGAVDLLPISDDAKNELREPMAEAGALIVQIYGAKVIHSAGKKALGKLKSKLVTKTHTTLAEKGDVTPADARIITNEVMKETPIEAKGTVVMNTQSGKVGVQTNQRLVLENFLKGKEDINYKRVKSLGYDPNGNPVSARFEWDYKAQKATIYTTNKTTAANLAHELGHYFDQKLSLKIAERFSELLPDYKTNRPAIKSALAEYAVHTLNGEATPAKIDARVNTIVTSFNKEMGLLATGEKRVVPTEQFATAVRSVITNPIQSQQIAPEFTQFVQYFTDKKGVLPSLVQTAAKGAEAPTIAKAVPAGTDTMITKGAVIHSVAGDLGGQKLPSSGSIKEIVNTFKKEIGNPGKDGVATTGQYAGMKIVNDNGTLVKELATTRVDDIASKLESTYPNQGVARRFQQSVKVGEMSVDQIANVAQDALKMPKPSTPAEAIKQTDIKKVPEIYKGKPVLEVENKELPLPYLMKKLETATKEGLDSALIKGIREEVKIRATAEATPKAPKTPVVPKVEPKLEPEAKRVLAESPKLYRGEVTTEGFAYADRTASQFAKGRYYTTSETYAQSYGDRITAIEKGSADYPKNPKVIDYVDLAKADPEYGFYQRGLKKEFGTADPERITSKLTEQGYDSLIIENVPVQRVGQPEYKLGPYAGTADEVIIFEKVKEAAKAAINETIKARQVEDGVVQYDSLYHGTTTTGLKELSPEASRRTSFGANAAVSATENYELARSFTKGELGDKPAGEIVRVKGPLNIIDTRTPAGKRIWESLGRNPKKALAAGYDGIQHPNYEQAKIESFYKDIDWNKVKDAHEVQIFRNTKVEPVKSVKTTPTRKTAVIETPAIKTAQVGQKTQPRGKKQAKTGVVEGRFGATGMKTGKTVEGRQSYNPEKINAPEDVQRLIEGVSKAEGEFSKQRISKTNDDVKALAQEVGVTPEELMQLKPGSIANAETVYKSRQLVADLAQDLRDTIRSITTETATKEQLLEVKTKLFRLQGTMKAVAGLRTEASNVFRQFQAEVMPGEFDIMTDLVSQLKKLDGKAGDDLASFTKGSKELLEPTYADKAWHLWYMSILSGASTQIKNIGGNVSQMIGEVAVEGVTNPKGFRNAMGGLFDGLVKGWPEFKRVMREGDISKFEERGQKPIRFTLGFEKAEGISKMLRQTGARVLNAADYVGRFMSGMDVWARTGFKGWEIRAQAREIGIKEGLSAEKLESRIEELTAKPIEEMIVEADKFAARGTYTQKPTGVLGALTEAVNAATRKVPLLRVVVPFTRIVANVTNNSLDWTPIGFKRALLPEGTFKTFGKLAKREKVEWLRPRARNQQLGRAVLGTAAMAYFASLAAENILSGNGPSNSNHRAQLEADGWRKNSIKIGDRWYPYQNWGPLAIPMTLVGNYFDFIRYEKQNADAGERMTAALLNTPNSILDMSFLSGASDLVTATQNIGRGGEKYFQRWAAQQITSPVPNLVKQTARYFDTTQYETKTLREQILYNLRVTTGLKPRLNVFGDAMKGEPLTQLQPGPKPDDELIGYLASNKLWVTVPSKATKIKPPGLRESRPMTEDEYYEYVKLSGIEIRKQLTRYLGKIRSMPDHKRQDYIDEVVQDIRQKVKRGIEIKARKN